MLEAQRVEVGKGRSWFVGDSVQEDGRLVVLTPINPVFLMLDVLERARRASRNLLSRNFICFKNYYYS